MRRTVTAFVSALALASTLVLAGCGAALGGGSDSGGKEETTLRYQGSVGQVTVPEIAADLGYLGDLKLKWIGNTISGPQDIQSAATGQTEFGGAFNGAIVKLVAAGAPIKAVVAYYGVDKYSYSGFYVLNGAPIHSARDLIGKKIGMNTLGAHSEAILDEYLTRNGFSQSELSKVERVVVPPVNTEQSLRQKQIDVAVLGSVLRDKALARGGIRPLFTDYQLLGDFSAGSIVFTDRFIKANPHTLQTFVAGISKAIEWLRTTPRAQIIARFTEIIQKRGRKEDTTLPKYFTSIGVAGTGGVISNEEFQRWISWLDTHRQLKKKVTPSDVYTNEFNPYAKTAAGS